MAKNHLVIALLFLSGCGAIKQPIHPGAVNQFDSQAYDALITIQAGIEEAKTQIGQYPAVKPELSRVIKAYNVTKDTYKAYHEALAAGKVADQAKLDALLAALKLDLASILAKLKPHAEQWRVYGQYADA